MGKTSRKRKFFVLLGLLLSVVIILIVAAPLWFPLVLPSILKRHGINYSRYERDGYSRFILHKVEWTKSETKFQAKEIRVLFPTTFLWRNFQDDRSENYLRASDWTLEFSPAAGEKSPGTNSAFYSEKKFDGILAQLNRWLPKATLDKGTIYFQDKKISIPVAEWADGNLSGRISAEKLLPETFFNARLGDKLPKGILIENPTWNLGGELTVTREKNDGLKLDGGALWQSNKVELAAQFGRQGWLPETASVKSDSFHLPAQIERLEGYHEWTGSLDLQWKTNRFTLDILGQAQPVQNVEVFLSPLSAALHASGDTNSILIETAKISSPWLEANLSKNAEFNFQGKMLSSNATLTVAADLSGQHWIDATGELKGEANLRAGTNRFPDTAFRLAGVGLSIQKIEMNQLDLQGEIDWPSLRINSAHVQFKEGAVADASLKFNAVTRQVAEGKLRLDGFIGQKFLPPEISYEHILLAGEYSGPLKQLSHSGHVELEDVKFPDLAPLGIVADWRGRQFDLENVQGNITAKDSSLAFGGSANYETNQMDLRVAEFALTKKKEVILNLQKPFAVSATRVGKENFSVAMEPLRLRGKETEISLDGKFQWPAQGNVSATARKLSFSKFRNFFEQPLPEVFVEEMNASADWTNGPVTFAVDGTTRFYSSDGTAFSAELRGNGNEKGVTIDLANVGTAAETILSGKGFLPLTLTPGRSNLVQILPKEQIDFHAETLPNAQFWKELEKRTQTGFRDPQVSVSISGTPDAPTGKVTASVREIVLKPKKATEPMPHLKNLLADFDLERDRIVLNRMEVFVEGQPVTASGELPLPKNLQTNWKKIFDWRKANVQLKMVDAQIAPFARLFPTLLSPLGTANLDLAIAQGNMRGELRVAGASLRPIPSVGPVHDIQGQVKFSGQRVALESFSGTVGGQPVNLSGGINLSKSNGTLPVFNLKLRGTNVPLARSSELILRSDIDLAISNEKGGEPILSGALNLRRSFYLSDLNVMSLGHVAKPQQRAPYFSLKIEPFARWRLDVAVQGTNFMKVRNPLFRGELSANFKLSGTLAEPTALGDIKIDSGVAQFPFANMRVTQGFISLTTENPYRPKLSVEATTRAFGYDVNMSVSGYADKPVVEFSSNPGLTTEQILLMVTAGELPRDEFNFTTQQRAGRLAFFLGKNLLSKFGAADGQEDRLEIRSGENISEQGQQTYYLEYKLNDIWSLVGEYDRFGAINGGFKWKFFEK